MEVVETSNSPSPREIDASIFFMRREDLHQYEKPYIMRFIADTELAPENFVYDSYENIRIENMRDVLFNFTIEQNGFTVLKMPSRIPYEEYHNPDGLGRYFRFLETILKNHLGASRVKVFRHNIRKRHSEFPVSTGKPYLFDQPTSVAHVDTTPDGALEELKQYIRIDGDQPSWKRIQWFNVWKPLRGPLNDWPLALCDTKSVNIDRDYEPTDILFENNVAENFQCHYHPDQRWYYLKSHQDDELLVFKQADTDVTASPGVLHSSFFNPHVGKNEPPRESIEVRLFAFYE